MDCDEETLQKLQTYLESFFETVKYGGFDQGHTGIVWYWAAQTLFQQGKALEEDGAYAVSMEDAKQWIKQNVIMPEGTEVRLSEGMPKADAKYPIAYDEGKLLFYCQQIKDTVSYKIRMVKSNNFTYSLAGEVTRSSEREESKESFSAQIDEDGAGVYRLTRLNTESFSSYFVETKSAPESKEYQERANEIWKRVSEGFGQKDMEGGNISGEELAGMKDALSLFFGTPMLGSFTQESMSSAVTFSVQKKLRSDMGFDELCHGNWIEIEKQYEYICTLRSILEKHGIPYPAEQ